ncbi:MAG TPA: BON domain-containing protein [Pirellulales bacterium]|nr:BON domain-containing protein [Pirellulales bacterium]
MDRKVPLRDADISQNVTRQLAGRGLRSPCEIRVQTRNGEVTLSGTVQYVHQRDAAVQAIRTVEGVKRVVEKLKVTPSPKRQHAQPTSQPQSQPKDKPEAVAQQETAKPQPATSSEPASSSKSTAVTSMPHTRKGDSYTFDCASGREAERLRVVLASYADWLKTNSWVGASKPEGKLHRVTFHAKSVIEFLRQEGF